MWRVVVLVIAAEPQSGTTVSLSCGGGWCLISCMCCSIPVSKSPCWPTHSSSINLQSSSWFLRAGCHLHQAGLHSFLRVFPGSCISQFYCFVGYFVFRFCFVLFLNPDKMDLHLLHFQLIFHYLKITFVSWIWAAAELCSPSSWRVHCSAAGCGWAFCFFGLLANRNESCWLHMSIQNWHRFSFAPSICSTQKLGSVCIFTFCGFPFPITSPACPKLGQASRLSLLFSTCYQHSWPVGAFHALSSLKWMVLKLCPPTLPMSYTPLKLPLQLSCPSLSAHCSFGSWLRVLQAGSSVLALPGWEGGREGAVPCCRWGRLLVQAVLVGPTAAHQTCSLAFPHPRELVLVLPETSLPYASDLEFPPSLYSCSITTGPFRWSVSWTGFLLLRG